MGMFLETASALQDQDLLKEPGSQMNYHSQYYKSNTRWMVLYNSIIHYYITVLPMQYYYYTAVHRYEQFFLMHFHYLQVDEPFTLIS
jgi:hypothetical protein